MTQESRKKRTLLLLINFQNDFLDDGRRPIATFASALRESARFRAEIDFTYVVVAKKALPPEYVYFHHCNPGSEVGDEVRIKRRKSVQEREPSGQKIQDAYCVDQSVGSNLPTELLDSLSVDDFVVDYNQNPEHTVTSLLEDRVNQVCTLEPLLTRLVPYLDEIYICGGPAQEQIIPCLTDLQKIIGSVVHRYSQSRDMSMDENVWVWKDIKEVADNSTLFDDEFFDEHDQSDTSEETSASTPTTDVSRSPTSPENPPYSRRVRNLAPFRLRQVLVPPKVFVIEDMCFCPTMSLSANSQTEQKAIRSQVPEKSKFSRPSEASVVALSKQNQFAPTMRRAIISMGVEIVQSLATHFDEMKTRSTGVPSILEQLQNELQTYLDSDAAKLMHSYQDIVDAATGITLDVNDSESEFSLSEESVDSENVEVRKKFRLFGKFRSRNVKEVDASERPKDGTAPVNSQSGMPLRPRMNSRSAIREFRHWFRDKKGGDINAQSNILLEEGERLDGIDDSIQSVSPDGVRKRKVATEDTVSADREGERGTVSSISPLQTPYSPITPVTTSLASRRSLGKDEEISLSSSTSQARGSGRKDYFAFSVSPSRSHEENVGGSLYRRHVSHDRSVFPDYQHLPFLPSLLNLRPVTTNIVMLQYPIKSILRQNDINYSEATNVTELASESEGKGAIKGSEKQPDDSRGHMRRLAFGPTDHDHRSFVVPSSRSLNSVLRNLEEKFPEATFIDVDTLILAIYYFSFQQLEVLLRMVPCEQLTSTSLLHGYTPLHACIYRYWFDRMRRKLAELHNTDRAKKENENNGGENISDSVDIPASKDDTLYEDDSTHIFRWLVSRGVDITTRTRSGETWLQLACRVGVFSAFQKELKDVSVPRSLYTSPDSLHYMTPLMWLCANGDAREVSTFLQACTDNSVPRRVLLNACNRYGITALGFALSCRSIIGYTAPPSYLGQYMSTEVQDIRRHSGVGIDSKDSGAYESSRVQHLADISSSKGFLSQFEEKFFSNRDLSIVYIMAKRAMYLQCALKLLSFAPNEELRRSMFHTQTSVMKYRGHYWTSIQLGALSGLLGELPWHTLFPSIYSIGNRNMSMQMEGNVQFGASVGTSSRELLPSSRNKFLPETNTAQSELIAPVVLTRLELGKVDSTARQLHTSPLRLAVWNGHASSCYCVLAHTSASILNYQECALNYYAQNTYKKYMKEKLLRKQVLGEAVINSSSHAFRDTQTSPEILQSNPTLPSTSRVYQRNFARGGGTLLPGHAKSTLCLALSRRDLEIARLLLRQNFPFFPLSELEDQEQLRESLQSTLLYSVLLGDAIAVDIFLRVSFWCSTILPLTFSPKYMENRKEVASPFGKRTNIGQVSDVQDNLAFPRQKALESKFDNEGRQANVQREATIRALHSDFFHHLFLILPALHSLNVCTNFNFIPKDHLDKLSPIGKSDRKSSHQVPLSNLPSTPPITAATSSPRPSDLTLQDKSSTTNHQRHGSVEGKSIHSSHSSNSIVSDYISDGGTEQDPERTEPLVEAIPGASTSGGIRRSSNTPIRSKKKNIRCFVEEFPMLCCIRCQEQICIMCYSTCVRLNPGSCQSSTKSPLLELKSKGSDVYTRTVSDAHNIVEGKGTKDSVSRHHHSLSDSQLTSVQHPTSTVAEKRSTKKEKSPFDKPTDHPRSSTCPAHSYEVRIVREPICLCPKGRQCVLQQNKSKWIPILDVKQYLRAKTSKVSVIGEPGDKSKRKAIDEQVSSSPVSIPAEDKQLINLSFQRKCEEASQAITDRLSSIPRATGSTSSRKLKGIGQLPGQVAAFDKELWDSIVYNVCVALEQERIAFVPHAMIQKDPIRKTRYSPLHTRKAERTMSSKWSRPHENEQTVSRDPVLTKDNIPTRLQVSIQNKSFPIEAIFSQPSTMKQLELSAQEIKEVQKSLYLVVKNYLDRIPSNLDKDVRPTSSTNAIGKPTMDQIEERSDQRQQWLEDDLFDLDDIVVQEDKNMKITTSPTKAVREEESRVVNYRRIDNVGAEMWSIVVDFTSRDGKIAPSITVDHSADVGVGKEHIPVQETSHTKKSSLESFLTSHALPRGRSNINERLLRAMERFGAQLNPSLTPMQSRQSLEANIATMEETSTTKVSTETETIQENVLESDHACSDKELTNTPTINPRVYTSKAQQGKESPVFPRPPKQRKHESPTLSSDGTAIHRRTGPTATGTKYKRYQVNFRPQLLSIAYNKPTFGNTAASVQIPRSQLIESLTLPTLVRYKVSVLTSCVFHIVRSSPEAFGALLSTFQSTVSVLFSERHKDPFSDSAVSRLRKFNTSISSFHSTSSSLSSLVAHTQEINYSMDMLQSRFLSQRNEAGNMPIHIAIMQGHLELVQDLISAGVNVSIANHDGLRAVHLLPHCIPIQGSSSTSATVDAPNLAIYKRLSTFPHARNVNVGWSDTIVNGNATSHTDIIMEIYLSIFDVSPFEVYAIDKLGFTPLHHAVLADQDRIIDLLCQVQELHPTKTIPTKQMPYLHNPEYYEVIQRMCLASRVLKKQSYLRSNASLYNTAATQEEFPTEQGSVLTMSSYPTTEEVKFEGYLDEFDSNRHVLPVSHSQQNMESKQSKWPQLFRTKAKKEHQSSFINTIVEMESCHPTEDIYFNWNSANRRRHLSLSTPSEDTHGQEGYTISTTTEPRSRLREAVILTLFARHIESKRYKEGKGSQKLSGSAAQSRRYPSQYGRTIGPSTPPLAKSSAYPTSSVRRLPLLHESVKGSQKHLYDGMHYSEISPVEYIALVFPEMPYSPFRPSSLYPALCRDSEKVISALAIDTPDVLDKQNEELLISLQRIEQIESNEKKSSLGLLSSSWRRLKQTSNAKLTASPSALFNRTPSLPQSSFAQNQGIMMNTGSENYYREDTTHFGGIDRFEGRNGAETDINTPTDIADVHCYTIWNVTSDIASMKGLPLDAPNTCHSVGIEVPPRVYQIDRDVYPLIGKSIFISPLTLAVHCRHKKSCDSLLRNGHSPMRRDDSQISPYERSLVQQILALHIAQNPSVAVYTRQSGILLELAQQAQKQIRDVVLGTYDQERTLLAVFSPELSEEVSAVLENIQRAPTYEITLGNGMVHKMSNQPNRIKTFPTQGLDKHLASHSFRYDASNPSQASKQFQGEGSGTDSNKPLGSPPGSNGDDPNNTPNRQASIHSLHYKAQHIEGEARQIMSLLGNTKEAHTRRRIFAFQRLFISLLGFFMLLLLWAIFTPASVDYRGEALLTWHTMTRQTLINTFAETVEDGASWTNFIDRHLLWIPSYNITTGEPLRDNSIYLNEPPGEIKERDKGALIIEDVPPISSQPEATATATETASVSSSSSSSITPSPTASPSEASPTESPSSSVSQSPTPTEDGNTSEETPVGQRRGVMGQSSDSNSKDPTMEGTARRVPADQAFDGAQTFGIGSELPQTLNNVDSNGYASNANQVDPYIDREKETTHLRSSDSLRRQTQARTDSIYEDGQVGYDIPYSSSELPGQYSMPQISLQRQLNGMIRLSPSLLNASLSSYDAPVDASGADATVIAAGDPAMYPSMFQPAANGDGTEVGLPMVLGDALVVGSVRIRRYSQPLVPCPVPSQYTGLASAWRAVTSATPPGELHENILPPLCPAYPIAGPPLDLDPGIKPPLVQDQRVVHSQPDEGSFIVDLDSGNVFLRRLAFDQYRGTGDRTEDEGRTDLWISPATSGLAIDFSLYSPTLNAFTAARLITYFPPATKAAVSSVKIRTFKVFSGRFIPSRIFQVMLMFQIIVHIMLIIRDMRKLGIKRYFSASGWHWYEVATLVFVIIVLSLDISALEAARTLQPDMSATTTFVDVWTLSNVIRSEIDFIAGTFYLLLLRCVKYLKIIPGWGPPLGAVINTVADKQVLLFLLVQFGCIWIMSVAHYIAFGTESSVFATLLSTFEGLFQLSYAEFFYYMELTEPRPIVSILFITSVIFAVLLTSLLIAVVTDSFIKHSNIAEKQWEDHITSLMQEKLMEKLLVQYARKDEWERKKKGVEFTDEEAESDRANESPGKEYWESKILRTISRAIRRCSCRNFLADPFDLSRDKDDQRFHAAATINKSMYASRNIKDCILSEKKRRDEIERIMPSEQPPNAIQRDMEMDPTEVDRFGDTRVSYRMEETQVERENVISRLDKLESMLSQLLRHNT